MVDYSGRRFDHYKLLSQKHEGSSTAVYHAYDEHLKRDVAIKVLRTDADDEASHRFFNEAHILGELDHPHIVTVLDGRNAVVLDERGEKVSVPYIVLKYAKHETLAKRYPYGQRLPMDKIMLYLDQLADALDYMHDYSNHKQCKVLLHLDIKPANVLLSSRDNVLIADFDNAKFVTSSPQRESSSIWTDQGVRGTPGYTAPERYDNLDMPTTDQYAVGVMLYEWFAGQAPFRGTTSQIIDKHLYQQPPPLHTIVPDISPAIEDVVLTALHKNPYARYRNLHELYYALDQARRTNTSRSRSLFALFHSLNLQ